MNKIKCVYDPLTELISYYGKDKTVKARETRTEHLSLEEKLKNRIIDGDKLGAEKDLTEALRKYSALDIINKILLEGMKVVGELFGSGQMQLPFVLQSAECMKTCVNFLEPHMEKIEGDNSKGTMVLATVKGDVHDIGKNLVDIILTNNGFRIINLGIKIPLEQMLEAYKLHNADAIGMSGLLVKSTAIMKENLEIMNDRNMEIPVILGGAALNRRFVEGELRELFKGDVYYANDAFDGLKYMNTIMEHRKAGTRPVLPLYKDNRNRADSVKKKNELPSAIIKSGIKHENKIPAPPFWGTKIVDNIPVEKAFEYINEVALFRGSWNVYKDRSKPDEEYQKLLDNEIYPKFNNLKLLSKREKLLIPAVIYGYFPCNSDGNELIIYKPAGNDFASENIWENISEKADRNELEEWLRFDFPRQQTDRHLCISDFFLPIESGRTDVVSFMIVTVGKEATEYAQKLYAENKYQDYLYFHGLSVETAEGLAEYWHKIIRKELGIDINDSEDKRKLFQQGYQGSRYSFGYPACPDLEDNKKMFELLKPERICITLTEEWQMVPEQSTNAIIVHHPEAKYFFVK
ncbi:MAG: B12-binding domain-containing protein [Ignavibacteria bacterium]|jgi:5-methyltetrahydrofolate--homocysteine methyltransferase|nr:B12-binding domain-containing protein [Ignavibacteria bacterium]